MPRATNIPTINFLRHRRQRLAGLQKQDRLVLWISLAVFLVVGLVATGMIVYAFSQSRQSASLQQEDEQASRTLKSMVNQEAQYLVYSARLNSLVDIWPQRGSQTKTLNFLTQLAMPGVDFQRVTFDQQNRTLEFTISSTDYFKFEEFIDYLRRPLITQQINDFSMENVSRTEEGKYRVDVSLQLKADI